MTEKAVMPIILGICVGVFLTIISWMLLDSYYGENISVDKKIHIGQQLYRISDVKVIDSKNIVLNVYKLQEVK